MKFISNLKFFKVAFSARKTYIHLILIKKRDD